jgi:hypothetical protein
LQPRNLDQSLLQHVVLMLLVSLISSIISCFFVLKLQILKILKNRSVRGLSVVAFELEVVGYTISLAYCLHKGLPFSAYGELAFLLIQGLFMASYVFVVNLKHCSECGCAKQNPKP